MPAVVSRWQWVRLKYPRWARNLKENVVHGACAVSARTTITPWVVCSRATYGRAARAGVKSGRPLNRSNGTALVKPQPGAGGLPAVRAPSVGLVPPDCRAACVLPWWDTDRGSALAETAPVRPRASVARGTPRI